MQIYLKRERKWWQIKRAASCLSALDRRWCTARWTLHPYLWSTQSCYSPLCWSSKQQQQQPACRLRGQSWQRLRNESAALVLMGDQFQSTSTSYSSSLLGLALPFLLRLSTERDLLLHIPFPPLRLGLHFINSLQTQAWMQSPDTRLSLDSLQRAPQFKWNAFSYATPSYSR